MFSYQPKGILDSQNSRVFYTQSLSRETIIENRIAGNGPTVDVKIPGNLVGDSVEILYQSPSKVRLPENPVVNLSEIIKKIIRCVTVGIWNGGDIREQLKQCLYQIADEL